MAGPVDAHLVVVAVTAGIGAARLVALLIWWWRRGQEGAARARSPLTVIIKNRLKGIQYRPGLIDGFLAQTGLILEPEPS